MKLILLGPPGSGKGTLAKLIVQNKHLKHISTGDLFREKIKEESELALLIKNLINAGEYVPDEITNQVAKDAILEANKTNPAGFILDGYPRTVAQAQYLDSIIDIDDVIYLDVDKKVLLDRIVGRRICSNCGAIYNIYTNPKPKVENKCDRCGALLLQRKDDNLETATHRIDVYLEQTQPLIDLYTKKGLLKRYDGAKPAEQIYEDVLVLFK